MPASLVLSLDQLPRLMPCTQDGKPELPVRVPAALIVVLLGLAAALWHNPRIASQLRLGPSVPRIVLPSRKQWLHGEPFEVQA